MLPMFFADTDFCGWPATCANVRVQEVVYFRILCLSSGAMLVSHAMSTFYSGQGKTWVVMLVDCGSVLLNVVLDYLWIFGHAGFPAMGIEGGAWATFVAIGAKVLIYAILLARPHNVAKFGSLQWAFQWPLCKRILHFGGPAGLQMLLEVAGFTAFVFLVGRLGKQELAATNLAFNVSSLAFMPVFGLSTAVSILVGQQLGQNQPDLAARGTWTSVWLATIYMSSSRRSTFQFPICFCSASFPGPVRRTTRTCAPAPSCCCVMWPPTTSSMRLNLVFVNAIKGAGDTRFVLCH